MTTNPLYPAITGNGFDYTPGDTKVAGWDGYWYDADGNAYAPADIPEETARTYYAVKPMPP